VCGYALQRQLAHEGVDCAVVAPSLVPRKPGERVKTDRRDAKKLATYWRSGALTEIQAPTPEQEATRDVLRCRDDLRQDLLRCRHRLSKMLLRRALVYRDGRHWTTRHRVWLRGLCWQSASDQIVFAEYLTAVELLEERLRMLDQRIAEIAAADPYREPVGWLRCFRGIDTVTAMTLVTEIHGFERFASARHLMAYLGLVPGEASSGASNDEPASPKRATRTPGGCSWKRHGTTGIAPP
jgi:transposase